MPKKNVRLKLLKITVFKENIQFKTNKAKQFNICLQKSMQSIKH